MSIKRLTSELVRRGLHGVGYEIFVQSFFDSNGDGIGDLNGLRQKLNYLSDLGITLIWLMPIHPAKTYHKYDVEDYMNIHPDYGTIDDFCHLVNECHERGILLILDLVANHTSYDHLWFKQAQLNSVSNPYRDYYIWMDSERVKKLGLHAFDTPDANLTGLWHKVGPESEHFDWEEFEKKSKTTSAVNKDDRVTSKLSIIHDESLTNLKPEQIRTNTYYALFDPRMPDLNYDCEYVQDEMFHIGRRWLELGVDGFRLDAAKYFYKPPRLKSNIAWWAKFRNEMSRINPSVYLIGEVWDLSTRIAPYLRSLDSMFNFELADLLISCILNEGNGSLMLKSYMKILNTYIKESDKQEVIDAIFLSNHDQNRVMSVFNNNLSKAKMAAALLLTLPGLPFIYYGEEIGMLGMKPHDKYRREPFLWSSTNCPGQTTWLEPLYTKISNGCIPLDKQLEDSNSLVNHYKKLIHIRCQSDILCFGSLRPIMTKIRCLCLFEREYNNKFIFIAHNIGSRRQCITIPEIYRQNKGKIIFSTQNENQIMNNGEFNLNGYSSVIIGSD
ncbi:unnamed protein product [Rotaria sp. Silwood1]|nr:unnamed protein product [Rotaria sp. Silwood1]CAF4754850.1 unnamed protein product [Rotaria sp. Silwood1]